MKKTLTVVFHINDMEAFELDNPNLKSSLLSGSFDEEAPWCIGAISVGNEIQRSGMIHHALNECNDPPTCKDLIGEIMELYEPYEFANFDWSAWDIESPEAQTARYAFDVGDQS